MSRCLLCGAQLPPGGPCPVCHRLKETVRLKEAVRRQRPIVPVPRPFIERPFNFAELPTAPVAQALEERMADGRRRLMELAQVDPPEWRSEYPGSFSPAKMEAERIKADLEQSKQALYEEAMRQLPAAAIFKVKGDEVELVDTVDDMESVDPTRGRFVQMALDGGMRGIRQYGDHGSFQHRDATGSWKDLPKGAHDALRGCMSEVRRSRERNVELQRRILKLEEEIARRDLAIRLGPLDEDDDASG